MGDYLREAPKNEGARGIGKSAVHANDRTPTLDERRRCRFDVEIIGGVLECLSQSPAMPTKKPFDEAAKKSLLETRLRAENAVKTLADQAFRHLHKHNPLRSQIDRIYTDLRILKVDIEKYRG